MDHNDLQFTTDEGIFSVRVRAIIISDGELLMIRQKKGYYYPVGGRIHQNETSLDAVVREVYEDTGLTMEPERIGFIHENLYSKNGVAHHEIGIYFYMHAPKDIREKLLTGAAGNDLAWLPVTELSNHKNLYPTFFKTRLLNPVDHLEHLFTWENWRPDLD